MCRSSRLGGSAGVGVHAVINERVVVGMHGVPRVVAYVMDGLRRWRMQSLRVAKLMLAVDPHGYRHRRQHPSLASIMLWSVTFA